MGIIQSGCLLGARRQGTFARQASGLTTAFPNIRVIENRQQTDIREKKEDTRKIIINSVINNKKEDRREVRETEEEWKNVVRNINSGNQEDI